jgi:hypothetical protein
MAGTIGSVGHGAKDERQRIWRRLIVSYFAGASIGGLVLGAPLAFLGLALDALERLVGAPRTYANLVGILILAVLALRDFGVVSLSLPTRRYQVPMVWKRLPGNWSAFAFGFALGTGVSTTIYLASFYAVGVIAILLRDLVPSLLVATTYSLARGLVILSAAHAPAGPDRLVASLAPRIRTVARINGIATSLVAFALGSSLR